MSLMKKMKHENRKKIIRMLFAPQPLNVKDENEVQESEIQTISSVGNKNLKMLVSEILSILKAGFKNPKMLASEILKIFRVGNKKSEMLASEIQTISAVRRPTPQPLNVKDENEVQESEIQTISAVGRQEVEKDDEEKVPTVINTGQAPNTPNVAGPTNGNIGESYEYTITSEDPQGDDVYYKISWGDCAVMFWDGPHKSGEEVTFEHAWCEVCFPGGGDFTIQVWVKDVNDNMGDCKTFEVRMGRGNHGSLISSSFLQFLENLLERFTLVERILDF